jgi:hypothetical protein
MTRQSHPHADIVPNVNVTFADYTHRIELRPIVFWHSLVTDGLQHRHNLIDSVLGSAEQIDITGWARERPAHRLK